MANPYSLVYADSVVSVLCSLEKPRLVEVLYDLRKLAQDPFVRSDYSVPDADGRPIEFLLAGEFVFGYFVDHAGSEVRIVDLSEVS